MKNVKEITRGDSGTYLEFTDKRYKSLMGSKNGKFVFESTIETPDGELVSDAPSDGSSYARNNNDWVIIPNSSNLDGRLITENTITVHPTDSLAAFNTIKDALDSITDSSPTNRYTLQVGSASYVEDNSLGPINIPSYVTIVKKKKKNINTNQRINPIFIEKEKSLTSRTGIF